MSGTVRRVVTGHDAQGKAIVISDGPSPFVHTTPLRPGYFSTDIFRTLDTPAPVTSHAGESTAGPRRQLPTPRGMVIRVNHFPPDRGSLDGMDAQTSSKLFESLGNPAGHTGVASGRQCGTNHAWSNRSSAPATVVFVLVDGQYDDDDLAWRLASRQGG